MVFISLQLIGFIFVVVLALIFVKNWKYKLIVIYSSLPIGFFLDSIPSNYAKQFVGNHDLFSAFSITVIPSLVLIFVYRQKHYNLTKGFTRSITSIVNLKFLYFTVETLILLTILIATLANVVVIVDRVYENNMTLAFNKIELNTSEKAVVYLMGKPSHTFKCPSKTGIDSGRHIECITEARYESFFYGWAIGYTESNNVISKDAYILIKPNLSLKRDWTCLKKIDTFI